MAWALAVSAGGGLTVVVGNGGVDSEGRGRQRPDLAPEALDELVSLYRRWRTG